MRIRLCAAATVLAAVVLAASMVGCEVADIDSVVRAAKPSWPA